MGPFVPLAIASVAGSLLNAGVSIYNNHQQQKENEKIREREDNAIQRRIADLHQAGLSATLSAGSPASTAQTSAPQLTGMEKALNVAQDLMALKQGKATIDHTNSQTELSKMQATSELFHQGVMSSQKSEIDLKNAWYDADMSSKMKLRGLQGDKISKEIGKITEDTALLKAKTAFEQVNADYIRSLRENALINQDILINNRSWNDYVNMSHVWDNFSKGGLLKTLAGGILGATSILENKFPGLQLDRGQSKWYYPK